MIYTSDQMRTYVRSLDARTKDSIKFPDAWVDDRIQEGIAIAQDTKPVFSTTEVYDLTANFTVDLLTDVEIILQQEIHSVYTVTLDTKVFSYKIMPNNHVVVSLLPNHPTITDYSVTIRYFFYPVLPISRLEMSLEMWKLVKEGIAINTFFNLSDETNQSKHQVAIQQLLQTGTFDTEKDLVMTPVDRLWRGTWA